MDKLVRELGYLLFRLVNNDAVIHDTALFLGVFLPLWLSQATSPGLGALVAAIPPALSTTIRYLWQRQADKRIKP